MFILKILSRKEGLYVLKIHKRLIDTILHTCILSWFGH